MRKPTCFVHLVLALALTPTVAFAGDVRVRLVGLQSGEGDALAALFESAAAFSAEKRSQRVARLVEGNTAELVFADVAPGIYGVSAFQDMNANGMIDKNFRGARWRDTRRSR